MSMEERLNEFLKENPNDSMVMLSLGNIYLREERTDEAIAILTKAAEATPDYRAVYPVLGDAYAEKDDLEAAKTAYERALELAGHEGDENMIADMEMKLESIEGDI